MDTTRSMVTAVSRGLLLALVLLLASTLVACATSPAGGPYEADGEKSDQEYVEYILWVYNELEDWPPDTKDAVYRANEAEAYQVLDLLRFNPAVHEVDSWIFQVAASVITFEVYHHGSVSDFIVDVQTSDENRLFVRETIVEPINRAVDTQDKDELYGLCIELMERDPDHQDLRANFAVRVLPDVRIEGAAAAEPGDLGPTTADGVYIGDYLANFRDILHSNRQ